MNDVISQLLADIPMPEMMEVEQEFDHQSIPVEELPAYILQKLQADGFPQRITPGMRVAVTAGSRGVANIALIIKTIVSFVKSRGASPFVIPAMGSHGGATAEGQREILNTLGVTEAYIGCPIVSSMDTVLVAETEQGHCVYIDRNAAAADGIIVVGRIKAHTCFRGPYESGIMKMMTIGLGKQRGAEFCHRLGFGRMAEMVPMIGKNILKHVNILFAVGIIENAYEETYNIVPLLPQEIEKREPELLELAKKLMPRILIEETDVLIVDKIGKNFSGDGMDPNITGTFCTPYASGGIKSQRVTVLDLSDETHGAAVGAGMADTTTKRLFQKFDPEKTYPNCITATTSNTGKIPMVMKNDWQAIAAAIKMCNGIDFRQVRVVRIPNSLHIGRIMISQSLEETAKATPGVRILGKPFQLPFDAQGNLF